MEGVAIMWLVHTSPAVRAVILNLLRLFSHPVFVALEDSRVPGLIRLVSYLPPADDASQALWSPHTVRFVSLQAPPPPAEVAGPPLSAFGGNEAAAAAAKAAEDSRPLTDRFRHALEYAWVRLVQRFAGALELLAELDSEKVGLWLNYAKFLCLSMPYPHGVEMPPQQQRYRRSTTLALDEPPVRVEPPMLEDFWANLLRVAWADGVPSGIRSALLNYFEQMHPTCISAAVRVIKTLRETPPPIVVERRRAFRKRAAKHDSEDELAASGWIFHEDVLVLFSRFATRLTKRAEDNANAGTTATDGDERAGPSVVAERAHSMSMGVESAVGLPAALPTSLVQTLQFCVAAWIADFERLGAESCRKLSLGTRFAGMRMVRVYLNPAAGAMGGYTDVPPANKMLQWLLAWTPPPRGVYVAAAYRHIPEFVAQLMVEEEEVVVVAPAASPEGESERARRDEEDRLRMLLEVAIVESLEALFALGSLAAGGGEAVQRVALHFIQMMALRGPHLRRPVERALSAFLRAQPNFCGLFFKLSVVEYSFDSLGLTMPAAELVSSIHLAAMVATWCTNLVEWQTRHGVSQPHMLLVCLLHQCSPDAPSRAAAIELATTLARHPTDPLDASGALPAAEFVALSSCVATTYKYSQVLALRSSTYLCEPLLREFVAIARLLPDVQNESMLHMVLPWVAQFGRDFSDETVDEWRDIWSHFLAHLLNISHQCHERANSSFLFFTLEACWTAVLQDKPSKALCELTMSFLVATHADATARAASSTQSPSSGTGHGAATSAEPELREAAAAAGLIRHLCERIVIFIGASGRAASMLTQLLGYLPTDGQEELPPPAHAQQLLDTLGTKASGASPPDAEASVHQTSGRQLSAFLLASELLIEHIQCLSHRVPLLLHMALVHFGPLADDVRVGSEFVSKLLAKVTKLSKEAREPLEAPPAERAGRAALVKALCESTAERRQGGGVSTEAVEEARANELSLREGWAAVALSWALSSPNEASAAQALAWLEVLTAHRPLSYGECHRLVGFITISLEAGRWHAAMATLTMLRDHTARLRALPYLNGALLCVVAIVTMNCRRVETFVLAQSLLRAVLDRTPASGAADIKTMQLLRREEPVLSPLNPFGRTLDKDELLAQYAFDADPGWKSRLLQEALDAQLGLWDARGQQLSADELLRMLLVRGGTLRTSRADTLWLLSELKAVYQPHLPEVCHNLQLEPRPTRAR